MNWYIEEAILQSYARRGAILMAKTNSGSGRSHVRFTKRDYRPYVRPIDLVNSENFQRELKKALQQRNAQLDNVANRRE